MNKHSILISCLCIFSFMAVAQAKQRDPFQPYAWNFSPEEEKSDASATNTDTQYALNPLKNSPLHTFALIGVIVSKEKTLAVIKTFGNKEFFVRVGDALGKEGGHIETIDSDGLTVNTGSAIIPIPVSNKIEINTNGTDH